MIGPMSVSKSAGSPTLMAFARSIIRPTNSSWSESGRSSRVPDSQACPLVEAEREERSVDRRVQVGVGQDDVRSLATELERDLLDVLRRLLGDEPAHRGRPGERDLADIGVS